MNDQLVAALFVDTGKVQDLLVQGGRSLVPTRS